MHPADVTQFHTIGVVVKTDARAAVAVSAQLLSDLHSRKLEVILSDTSAQYLQVDETSLPLESMGERCDLVIAMGGDGTLLAAGRALAASGVPLLGVNLGRLGFMVDIAPADITASLNRILDGDFVVEERLILEAWSGNDEHQPQIAINDVVVRHRRFVRMLDFATHADGNFISQHRADGIIISTPTGSTAYALSSGGPMMHPGLEAIALVPISPHTLSDRPLIVDADSRLSIQIAEAAENAAFFTCDGQIDFDLEPGSCLHIARSPHRLRLVHPSDYDYFGILRNKLNWGSNRKRS